MTFRRFEPRALPRVFSVWVLSVCLGPASGLAQNPQAPAAPTPPPAAAPAQPPAPDYPDPRTLTIGAFYWLTGIGTTMPNVNGGSQSFNYQPLNGLGKAKQSPAIEVSYPISRTGTLRFEIFETKGDGNQIAPADLFVFGQSFNKGDALASQYQMFGSKLYLDDLLFPHKFPVAKFRLKSLWEFQYIHMKSTIDAPLLALTAPETAIGTRQIFLPTFGLAAEYAIAPHVLLRADASGFGIPHRSDIWDAAVTLSYRHGSWEVMAGGKALHFKTSPNNVEYVVDTLSGAFVGIRWHWSL